jgi:hypothetical protein
MNRSTHPSQTKIVRLALGALSLAGLLGGITTERAYSFSGVNCGTVGCNGGDVNCAIIYYPNGDSNACKRD